MHQTVSHPLPHVMELHKFLLRLLLDQHDKMRLWFAGDVWRYKNVLIDWLVCYRSIILWVHVYVYTHIMDLLGSGYWLLLEYSDWPCFCVWFLFVYLCLCDKTKTVQNTITKLSTRIVYNELTIPHPSVNIRSKGQGHRVKKCKKGDQVASVSYALCWVPSL